MGDIENTCIGLPFENSAHHDKIVYFILNDDSYEPLIDEDES